MAQNTEAPHPLLVHLALIATQVSFGSGAVVGKFGVHGTNPVLFALIREGTAGPLLCLFAYCRTRRWLPHLQDVPRLLQAGFAVFGNQFFFIVGLKLADPTTAAAWQPAQPIMTLVLAVLLGMETLTCRRVTGILMAVLGAVVLVIGDAHGVGSSSNSFALQLCGHVCFFLNDLGTSCYVIRTKALLGIYDSVSVTGWAYIAGSLMMLLTATCINSIPWALHFVCSDSDPAVEASCVDGAWKVPTSMLWPLLYWILMSSLLAYYCMTWANQFAKASVVSAYTVLQPVASGVLSCMLVLLGGSTWASRFGFKLPGWSDLGVIPIFAGLACVFSQPSMDDESSAQSSARSGLSSDSHKVALVGGSSAVAAADAESAAATQESASAGVSSEA